MTDIDHLEFEPEDPGLLVVLERIARDLERLLNGVYACAVLLLLNLAVLLIRLLTS